MIAFLVLSFVLLDIVLFGLLKDFTKTDREYKLKKILDIFIYIYFYVYLIFANSLNFIEINWIFGFSIFESVLGILPLVEYKLCPERIRTTCLKYTLISCVVEFIISMPLTYFALYIINSTWFEIGSTKMNTVPEYIFEFIYLTFSIITTYNGGNIVACGIIPRIFQMIHIILIVTIIGSCANILLKDNKDNKN